MTEQLCLAARFPDETLCVISSPDVGCVSGEPGWVEREGPSSSSSPDVGCVSGELGWVERREGPDSRDAALTCGT